MTGGKVVSLFGERVADRMADKVVPPVRAPTSLDEFKDAGQVQLARDRQVNQLGTWLALGCGVAVFFIVRDWRLKKRSK